ncbi:MAG TPA: hypothetical protein VGK94_14780 [Candidatus Polarisedimenticolia bacterium]|jgi:hypothetical protein
MKNRSNGLLKHLLVIAALAWAVLSAAGTVLAYTVVTRDGHRIAVQSKPEIRGLQAFMRLAPHGQLAVMQEDLIDWAGTESANPIPSRIAVPSSTIMTVVPAGPARTIEFNLKGNSASKGTGGESTERPAAPGEGSAEQKKVNAQEAIIKLQKEYAQVASARDQEAASKKSWEEELAQLRAKEVGYASETNSTQQRIRELQQMIDAANSRIGQLDTRLGDIRSEAVQLGGTID